MGLFVIGGPMVEIGRVDVTGKIRGGCVEGALLGIERWDVAGGAIGPLAGLGGSKADGQLAASVPKGGHEIGLKMRRAELGVKLRADVWIGMRGEIGGRKIEYEFAQRVSG